VKTSTVLLAVLAATLVLQLGVLLLDRTPLTEEPLRVLTGDDLGSIADGALMGALPDGCFALYFASPSCGACQQLALELRGHPNAARAVWLFDGSATDVSRFVDTLGVEGTVLRLGDLRSGEATLREIGIHATPTTATVGRDRRLRRIRVGQIPLTDSVVREVCVQAPEDSLVSTGS